MVQKSFDIKERVRGRLQSRKHKMSATGKEKDKLSESAVWKDPQLESARETTLRAQETMSNERLKPRGRCHQKLQDKSSSRHSSCTWFGRMRCQLVTVYASNDTRLGMVG